MLQVKDIIEAIESQAPVSLQENWDNCGLQVGGRNQPVQKVLTALDVTREVLDEAISLGADMIVSHHPLIFKGLKSIDMDTHLGHMIHSALQHSIAIYSAHTNLDITEGGLNDVVAQQLGLENIVGLVETKRDSYYKLAVFTPPSHSEQVRRALGDAGAGQLGQYSHCSFSVLGTGRFYPLEGAHPYVGAVGSIEEVLEDRIEVLVPDTKLHQVLQVMKAVHPYEEVAYDIIPLTLDQGGHYLGRMGHLQRAMPLQEWIDSLGTIFPYSSLRFGGAKPKEIHTIALCTGSGAEFISVAAKRGADVYITGDVKYHDMQLAKELGILVVDAGHYGTEAISQTILKDYIMSQYRSDEVEVIESKTQADFFFKL